MATRSGKKMKPTIYTYVPDDFVFSLLSRLPVKILVRYTSVCKSWNAMIRSSTFAAAHHRYHQLRNIDNGETYTHLLYMQDDPQKEQQFCTLIHESDVPRRKTYVRQSDLYLPLRGSFNFVGACEGLICLIKDSSDIYIWNPFIRSLKIVPPGGPMPPGYSWPIFGFGFAPRSCDYRVIKLIYLEGRVEEVDIYSLAADSWRRINCNTGRWMLSYKSEIFFEGSIYWSGLSSHILSQAKRIILRFDLEEETFEEMEAPPISWYLPKLELAVANGVLLVLQIRELDWMHMGHAVTVWAKKESPSDSSSPWTRLENFCLPKNRNRPMVKISKGGHFIFERTKDQKLFTRRYDRVSRGFKFNDLEIFSRSEIYYLIPVKETLFLLR